MTKFQEGISNKVSNFFQFFTTFVVGFILGFIYGWKLCLVIIAVSPLLIISGIFMTYVSIKAAVRDAKSALFFVVSKLMCASVCLSYFM